MALMLENILNSTAGLSETIRELRSIRQQQPTPPPISSSFLQETREMVLSSSQDKTNSAVSTVSSSLRKSSSYLPHQFGNKGKTSTVSTLPKAASYTAFSSSSTMKPLLGCQQDNRRQQPASTQDQGIPTYNNNNNSSTGPEEGCILEGRTLGPARPRSRSLGTTILSELDHTIKSLQQHLSLGNDQTLIVERTSNQKQ